MIDSGRFNPTRDDIDMPPDMDMMDQGDAVSPSATEIELDSAIGQSSLFDLGQIDVRWDADLSALWAFMTPANRPNFSMPMLRDVRTWYVESKRLFDAGILPVKYLIAGSRFPGVFNLGGDLELFAGCIERGDLPVDERFHPGMCVPLFRTASSFVQKYPTATPYFAYDMVQRRATLRLESAKVSDELDATTDAIEQLNAITGEFTADDLLGVIFSSFCIGK